MATSAEKQRRAQIFSPIAFVLQVGGLIGGLIFDPWLFMTSGAGFVLDFLMLKMWRVLPYFRTDKKKAGISADEGDEAASKIQEEHEQDKHRAYFGLAKMVCSAAAGFMVTAVLASKGLENSIAFHWFSSNSAYFSVLVIGAFVMVASGVIAALFGRQPGGVLRGSPDKANTASVVPEPAAGPVSSPAIMARDLQATPTPIPIATPVTTPAATPTTPVATSATPITPAPKPVSPMHNSKDIRTLDEAKEAKKRAEQFMQFIEAQILKILEKLPDKGRQFRKNLSQHADGRWKLEISGQYETLSKIFEGIDPERNYGTQNYGITFKAKKEDPKRGQITLVIPKEYEEEFVVLCSKKQDIYVQESGFLEDDRSRTMRQTGSPTFSRDGQAPTGPAAGAAGSGSSVSKGLSHNRDNDFD